MNQKYLIIQVYTAQVYTILLVCILFINVCLLLSTIYPLFVLFIFSGNMIYTSAQKSCWKCCVIFWLLIVCLLSVNQLMSTYHDSLDSATIVYGTFYEKKKRVKYLIRHKYWTLHPNNIFIYVWRCWKCCDYALLT